MDIQIDGITMTLSDEERMPCEIWSRVMGYHRPISAWNAGKQAEHRERLQFRESSIMAGDR